MKIDSNYITVEMIETENFYTRQARVLQTPVLLPKRWVGSSLWTMVMVTVVPQSHPGLPELNYTLAQRKVLNVSLPSPVRTELAERCYWVKGSTPEIFKNFNK